MPNNVDAILHWLTEGAESHVVSAWIFLRLLGVTYAIAFASLLVQVKGLSGLRGIAPAQETLREVESLWRDERLWLLPTLCWWKCNDGFLLILCWAGLVSALLLAIGFAPVPLLLLLWIIYISMFNATRPWLGYQWDVLLLETGFLAIFVAPLQWMPEWPPTTAPPRIVLWLLFWLLVRLMFSSGAAKWLSRDHTWRNLTALKWHYETQPLPNPGAWWLHQMPLWFQKFSAVGMFVIEVGLAPLALFPPPFRYIGAGAIILLMLLIMLTGNYGFFNVLTIVLALLLLEDHVWHFFPTTHAIEHGWPSAVLLAFGGLLFLLSIDRMLRLFRREIKWLGRLSRVFEPFHLVSSYGLFSTMTTERLEIIVEGSRDGHEWLLYEFKYKPGDVKRRLPMPAPHQPRLDWQMWFTALSDYRTNPWFIAFLIRLLQGQKSVVRLLKTNPFPDAPPKFIRATVYQYWLTTRSERQRTGAVWKREWKWLYCPVFSLQGQEEWLMRPLE